MRKTNITGSFSNVESRPKEMNGNSVKLGEFGGGNQKEEESKRRVKMIEALHTHI
jgi:hypothetical protein